MAGGSLGTWFIEAKLDNKTLESSLQKAQRDVDSATKDIQSDIKSRFTKVASEIDKLGAAAGEVSAEKVARLRVELKEMADQAKKTGTNIKGLAQAHDSLDRATDKVKRVRLEQARMDDQIRLSTKSGTLQQELFDANAGTMGQYGAAIATVTAAFSGGFLTGMKLGEQAGVKFGTTFEKVNEILRWLVDKVINGVNSSMGALLVGIAKVSRAIGKDGFAQDVLDAAEALKEINREQRETVATATFVGEGINDAFSPDKFKAVANPIKSVVDAAKQAAQDELAYISGILDSINTEFTNNKAAMSQIDTDYLNAAVSKNQQLADHSKMTESIILRFKQEHAQKAVEAAEKEAQQKIGFAQMTLGYIGSALSQLAATQDTTNKKGFERAKKLKMAEVIVNTASAIIRGYSDLGPIGGTVWAVVMSAIGAMQLKQIKSQKYDGGGGAVSPGGGGGVPTASAAAAGGGGGLPDSAPSTPSTTPATTGATGTTPAASRGSASQKIVIEIREPGRGFARELARTLNAYVRDDDGNLVASAVLGTAGGI